MGVEERLQQGIVVAGISRVRGNRFRLRAWRPSIGRRYGEGCPDSGGGAFGVGHGRRARPHGGAVGLLEGDQGLGG
ncbi:hypothetical protein [Streptomyces lavendofoliae]|uniref:hypothetical protein n=1 Tax=Streptomyces lavendofoliae TaxID=67314 RepID=UPI003D93701B